MFNYAMLAQFLPTIISLIKVGAQVRTAYNTSTTNTLGAVHNVLVTTTLVPELEKIGAQLFPKAAPALHAAAAALVILHPDATSWLQAALNAIMSPADIQAATGKPALDVDGHYGPKTRAAVESLQAKHGLPVTGLASDIENGVIMAALSALGG